MNLKDNGVGKVADILFFTLMVSLASLLLIGSYRLERETRISGYPEEVAQNTLLILQNLPAEKLGDFSYTPNFCFGNVCEKSLGRKTSAQLIVEGIMIDPKWVVDNKFLISESNSNYQRELKIFLRDFLDRGVGRRFGYRFIVRANPVKVSRDRFLKYHLFLEDLDEKSKRLCSESMILSFAIPWSWVDNGLSNTQGESVDFEGSLSDSSGFDFSGGSLVKSPDPSGPFERKMTNLRVTLELWSR